VAGVQQSGGRSDLDPALAGPELGGARRGKRGGALEEGEREQGRKDHGGVEERWRRGIGSARGTPSFLAAGRTDRRGCDFPS
jgi:hypothetical protein